MQINIGHSKENPCHLSLLDSVREDKDVVNHYFNDHTNCGQWCYYSRKEDNNKILLQFADTARKY